MTPPERILGLVDTYAMRYGYDDYLVTIDLAGEIITEILLCENGELAWVNDWWEGETDIRLLGFAPISNIRIYSMFNPGSSLVYTPKMRMQCQSDFRPETICSDAQHRYCLKCTDPLRGQYPFCPLNPPEVVHNGT